MVDFNYFLPFITGCLGFHFIFPAFLVSKSSFSDVSCLSFFLKTQSCRWPSQCI